MLTEALTRRCNSQMTEISVTDLERFIVAAKAATYVGSGQKLLPYRLGSTDLQYREGDWAYHDGYLGNTDFLGQEVVYYRGRPVWAMNYYGRILRDDLISAAEAGAMIKESLTQMYKQRRFLGGFQHSAGDLAYTDTSQGDLAAFTGREWIDRGGEPVYQLEYHGGLVRA